MANIIVKSYEHFNRALPNWHSKKGRYISSKKQYIEECKKAGLEPYREPTVRENKPKASKETRQFLNSVKNSADKKGNVKLSDRQIDYMVKSGAIKDRDSYYDKLPKHYQDNGGFK
jgi:ribosomal protein S21